MEQEPETVASKWPGVMALRLTSRQRSLQMASRPGHSAVVQGCTFRQRPAQGGRWVDRGSWGSEGGGACLKPFTAVELMWCSGEGGCAMGLTPE
jgi:hypothetical protein